MNLASKMDGIYSASRDLHPELKGIQKVNRLFYSFLCNFGKGDKIKRDILLMTAQMGASSYRYNVFLQVPKSHMD